ncbi:MAG: hypothetical protein JNM84_00185 [Planctomycetes bacterium]|nr:hypothetical protein [Planctomycetota bacterium]
MIGSWGSARFAALAALAFLALVMLWHELDHQTPRSPTAANTTLPSESERVNDAPREIEALRQTARAVASEPGTTESAASSTPSGSQRAPARSPFLAVRFQQR